MVARGKSVRKTVNDYIFMSSNSDTSQRSAQDLEIGKNCKIAKMSKKSGIL